MLDDSAARRFTGEHMLLSIRAHRRWQERLELLARPDALERFLDHVACTVPFYRLLLGQEERLLTLASFPLVTRSQVSSARTMFVSSAYLEESARFEPATSGTTGPPMTVNMDMASWYDLNVGAYASVARAIPGLLEAAVPGEMAVALVSNKPTRSAQSIVIPPLKAALLHRLIMGKGEEEDLRILALLRDRPLPLLYGKASYLLDLAALESRWYGPASKRIRPMAVFVSGENLFENHRHFFKDRFGCAVYSGYLSKEGGVIALDCPYHRGLHVRRDTIRLEVNTGAAQEEEGTGELVLTNLMNWCMPFVRYATGDLGTVSTVACPCGFEGQTITDLPGRDSVAFATEHGRIATVHLDKTLESLPVLEFQLQQIEPMSFVLRWIPLPGGWSRDEASARVEGRLRERLGPVRVRVEEVERLTPPGGKMRRYLAIPAQDSRCSQEARDDGSDEVSRHDAAARI